jgi:hypothetical protein
MHRSISIRWAFPWVALLVLGRPAVAESGASDLAGAIERTYADRPQEPLPQARDLPPLN